MRKQSIISSRLVAILAALAVVLVAVAVILSKCEGTAVVEEKSDHVEVTPATIASIKSIGQWEFLTIHDEGMSIPCAKASSATTAWPASITVRCASAST